MPVKKPRKGKAEKKGEGRTFEKGVEEFGEEIGRAFGKFGKRAEARGKRFEKHGKGQWCERTFGVAGAVLSAILGMICFGIGIFILRFINGFLGIAFITAIENFMAANAAIFFLIFLFSGFTKYFSCTGGRAYTVLKPWVAGVTIVIIAWVVSEFIFIANAYIMSSAFAGIAFWLQANYGLLFWIFVVFGYIVLLGMEASGCCVLCAGRIKTEKGEKVMTGGKGKVKRLYRSGKDKILGGVCGGIGEYLKVDPVIIRLLWIVATLAWGTGILAYIIAWIIIPRNPAHKWED